MLQFAALRAAAAGELILPYFDYLPGLAALVSKRSRYVSEWVRVFYAIIYVEVDRLSIHFMFMGQQQTLNREGITELLGVELKDDSIHYVAYPDVEAPRRAHTLVLPSDDEISFLFQQPFLPYTPQTPGCLTRGRTWYTTRFGGWFSSGWERTSRSPVCSSGSLCISWPSICLILLIF
jgi:hypothetical protein